MKTDYCYECGKKFYLTPDQEKATGKIFCSDKCKRDSYRRNTCYGKDVCRKKFIYDESNL